MVALAAPASLLPFNRACSGERKLVWSKFSFAEALAIRAALKGTVNDVVLTVLAGAVARYAELHGQQVARRKLRVMVPVSLRREEHRGTLGNLVSLCLWKFLSTSATRSHASNKSTADPAMKSARPPKASTCHRLDRHIACVGASCCGARPSFLCRRSHGRD